MHGSKQLSLETRRAMGRALRDQLSRREQGEWETTRNRPDPVAILTAAVARRDADALRYRWGRMAASPFTFLRGNTALMAWDLGAKPTTGLLHQLCGDPHVLNLGAYAAPHRTQVFDLNDFDETCRGPWEWDLKRLAVSVILGGEDAGHDRAGCEAAVRSCGAAYRQAIHSFADMAATELARADVDPGDGHEVLDPIFQKAARDTPSRLKEKGVEEGPEGTRFRSLPPGLRPLEEEEALPYRSAWGAYAASLPPAWRQVLEKVSPTAFGRRISGCGSMGVRNVLVFCEGGSGEFLFLEFKGQPGSAWGAHAQPDAEPHRGQAVAAGQQRLQTWSDPFLGWTTVSGMPFLVRQWSDHKASLTTADLGGETLAAYARICGSTLAKGHARSGEPGRLSGYLGRSEALDEAMVTFAANYAEQVRGDWEALQRAIRSGKLDASTEY